VTCVYAYVIISRRYFRPAVRFDPVLARRLLKMGLPFALVFFLNTVYFLIDVAILSGLRPLTGRDAPVGAFIEADTDFAPFFKRLCLLLAPLLPRYEREGKSYLTIAIGCTGGRHRSVYLAERLAAWLSEQGRPVGVNHRDLDQWERVHLALGLAAVLSGCYGIGAVEAALALTPEIERMPKVKLPSDPIYERFDLALFERALNEVWVEPARRFPYFRRIEAL